MVVGELTQEIDLLVIGAGPGGYVAACAGADAGFHTGVVDAADVPGGVCLREGCIPSKTLLNVAKIIDEANHASKFGLSFEKPGIDVKKLRNWKNSVIKKLSSGVQGLLKGREIEYFRGKAVFESSKIVRIEGEENTRIQFKHCIIATGSSANTLPESLIARDLYWDAAQALAVEEIPQRLLVIGGGYIGLELGQVYAGLGSEVTVLEVLPQILTGVDPDIAKPLASKLNKQMKAIHTGAQLKGATRTDSGITVTFEINGEEKQEEFDRILASVGRRPNTADIGIENTKVDVNERGFIKVDKQLRTSDKKIFAIGDVIGNPMLAHKAMREAKIAVEVISGKPSVFEPACIPAVVYTDPEVAWVGVTETEAKEKNLNVKVSKFPWAASGRAVSMSRTEGLTKMIFDSETQRLLGVAIVGAHAGDLIAEGALGLEMAAVAEDIAATIHPHPATCETLAEAAEGAFGKAIHGAH